MNNLPKGFKPMKGELVESLEDLRFPLIAMPKLDGFRCIVDSKGNALSSSLKPIRNKHIREALSTLRNLDGEITVGPPTGQDVYSRTIKAGITRETAKPDFTFWVFDTIPHDEAVGESPYDDRVLKMAGAALLASRRGVKSVKQVEWRFVTSVAALREVIDDHQAKGYEGTMVRDPYGPYKHGKSTVKEGWLLKVKPYDTDEAEIIGVIEGETNTNEATKDALGRTKRSSAKAGKVKNGRIGKFLCRGLTGAYVGKEFSVSPGALTLVESENLWKSYMSLGLGGLPSDVITFERCEATGGYDKPRHPNFFRFRTREDMTS